VAVEAGLPPSAVHHYFATVDELLLATLVAGNDRAWTPSTRCPRTAPRRCVGWPS
jgi:hypothetical protein